MQQRAPPAAAAGAAPSSGGPSSSGSERAASSGGAGPSERASEAPWSFAAQTNARLLRWDDGAQAQLLRIVLCQQLGVNQEQLAEQLAALGNLLPGLVAKLHVLRAPLVLALLKDLPGVAARLLALRGLLPGGDIEAMCARAPELMLTTPLPQLEAAVRSLQQHLPGAAIGPLVEREPMLLRADAAALVAEARRLMPGKDPVAVIAADPSALIDMEVAGLPSTLEFN